ncbi:MAG: acyl carrier protein [Oscillospiraceae bacterium]|jgi:acyl carrier protein|nr:acyl carrier protein [Oscillospiraceae bacterium]
MDFETIAQIVAEQFDMEADELTEETDIIDDLGCSSLDAVELIVAIESATDVRIPDEAVDSIRTIGDIVAYLSEHAEAPDEDE